MLCFVLKSLISGTQQYYTKNIYSLTSSFPKQELFPLVDQLRRSSSSIAANIAEGSGSASKKDFSHYLDIAIKSTYESVSHLQLARELLYITDEQRDDLYNEADRLARKIRAFKRWLSKNS